MTNKFSSRRQNETIKERLKNDADYVKKIRDKYVSNQKTGVDAIRVAMAALNNPFGVQRGIQLIKDKMGEDFIYAAIQEMGEVFLDAECNKEIIKKIEVSADEVMEDENIPEQVKGVIKQNLEREDNRGDKGTRTGTGKGKLKKAIILTHSPHDSEDVRAIKDKIMIDLTVLAAYQINFTSTEDPDEKVQHVWVPMTDTGIHMMTVVIETMKVLTELVDDPSLVNALENLTGTPIDKITRDGILKGYLTVSLGYDDSPLIKESFMYLENQDYYVKTRWEQNDIDEDSEYAKKYKGKLFGSRQYPTMLLALPTSLYVNFVEELNLATHSIAHSMEMLMIEKAAKLLLKLPRKAIAMMGQDTDGTGTGTGKGEGKGNKENQLQKLHKIADVVMKCFALTDEVKTTLDDTDKRSEELMQMLKAEIFHPSTSTIMQ